jgi:DNA adenine methylase
VNMASWHRQKAVCENLNTASRLELGFAAFFLNRTNRSGILTGGVIGGKEQKGNWKIDARFNKESLCLKIETISTLADQVSLYRKDAEGLITDLVKRLPRKCLYFLDPPYYVKSKRLYQDLYSADDHARIAGKLRWFSRPWVLSYDDVPQIRALYSGLKYVDYELSYSAAKKERGAEIVYISPKLKMPSCAPVTSRRRRQRETP